MIGCELHIQVVDVCISYSVLGVDGGLPLQLEQQLCHVPLGVLPPQRTPLGKRLPPPAC